MLDFLARYIENKQKTIWEKTYSNCVINKANKDIIKKVSNNKIRNKEVADNYKTSSLNFNK